MNDNIRNEETNHLEEISQENSEKVETTAEPSAQEQLAQQKEYYLAVIAEYENRMKRTMQDAHHSISATLERLLSDLVPIMNDITQASQLVNNEAKAGLNLIEKNVKNTLNKYGIQEIVTKIGDDFDPHSHQAIGSIEHDSFSEGKIIEIKQIGYVFNKRVILPSMVIVAK